MRKPVFTIVFLTAAVSGFLAARQSTARLGREANAARAAWQTQTQQLATTQAEQADLAGPIRSLKQSLAEIRAAAANTPWIALQSNRADHLAPDLRERLLEELDFNWQLSPDYVVVTKQTLRDLQLKAVQDGHLTELAARVLSVTPVERSQTEAALQQVKQAFSDWVLAHVERAEPGGDLVAQYTLPGDPATVKTISDSFATALSGALGSERAELLRPSAEDWMRSFGFFDCGDKPATLTVSYYQAAGEQRLKFEIQNWLGRGSSFSRDLTDDPNAEFPRVFRPLFPNGWAEVAKREGFELPMEPGKK
jgi:hypothetical protein